MNYFRYKQFNKDVITVAVGYYLRYALSYRDISEILRERGVNIHHSTVYVGFKNMPQFCIKFGRKSIKKLITNGVLMRCTSKSKESEVQRENSANSGDGQSKGFWGSLFNR